jgi:hypothetical protein
MLRQTADADPPDRFAADVSGILPPHGEEPRGARRPEPCILRDAGLLPLLRMRRDAGYVRSSG